MSSVLNIPGNIVRGAGNIAGNVVGGTVNAVASVATATGFEAHYKFLHFKFLRTRSCI